MLSRNTHEIATSAMLAVLILLSLGAAAPAQDRKPVALIFDTPGSDIDCPKVETALRDAFAVSPRYQIVELTRLADARNSPMVFIVSCLSLPDKHVVSVYYTVQNFDDNAKAKTSHLFSTQANGHHLVIEDPKAVGNLILVSFDQSVKKHYEQ